MVFQMAITEQSAGKSVLLSVLGAALCPVLDFDPELQLARSQSIQGHQSARLSVLSTVFLDVKGAYEL